MKKITITLENFEGISESQGNQLVGGFSQSFSGQGVALRAAAANNCNAGNCVEGCGHNISCNTVAGCGGERL